MTVTISQDISVEGPNTALINGTVSNPASITGVEIFDDQKNDLGAADLDRSGTWIFDAFFDPNIILEAVATDTAGNTEKSAGLGIFTSDPLPQQIVSVTFGDDSETYSVFARGGRALYDGNVTDTGGQPLEVVFGRGGAGIAFADTESGHEIIKNFRVARHDTLNVADSFHNLVQVLNHTTMNAGSATIHTANDTSVTLTGVTKQQIASHPHDFVFTGGPVPT